MNELTTERLNEIIADTGPRVHAADCTERYRMALELKAKREECYALLAVIDEGSIEPFDIGPCVISGPIGLRDRGGMIEVRHEVMQGVFAQLALRVSEKVPGAIESIRRLWLVEAERDAARAEAKKYHAALVARHGGEPIALLSELDEARAEAEKLRAELDAVKRQRDELR